MKAELIAKCPLLIVEETSCLVPGKTIAVPGLITGEFVLRLILGLAVNFPLLTIPMRAGKVYVLAVVRY